MVRAILDGRKTQTRRTVKAPKGHTEINAIRNGYIQWKSDCGKFLMNADCPYGKPGDRLVVRESWKADQIWDGHKPSDIPKGEPILYTADEHATGVVPFDWGKGRPSIFLPRWASRILLEVVSVRVERLQDISEEDVDAEVFGGDFPDRVLPGYGFHGGMSMKECFQVLWESINGPGSWEANPWVWAVEFKKIGGDK